MSNKIRVEIYECEICGDCLQKKDVFEDEDKQVTCNLCSDMVYYIPNENHTK